MKFNELTKKLIDAANAYGAAVGRAEQRLVGAGAEVERALTSLEKAAIAFHEPNKSPPPCFDCGLPVDMCKSANGGRCYYGG